MRRPFKPERPYKSLADFRYHIIRRGGASESFFKENSAKFPCLVCNGRGTIYDPKTPPRSVEGNKGRNRIKCTNCGGTRCHDAKAFKAYYQAVSKLIELEIKAIAAFHAN